ncbi:hypothetical protein ETB97_003946 [Aspergillus alliaceus]|uniref:Mitochondrial ATPase inhibitor n=1 Tax=Petromyces alliaceus TaxID=209559 RepID=A0A8H6A0Y7_PETAA|nr:hypothetical protein ETB97_003946 [Aspergillus burnettii]
MSASLIHASRPIIRARSRSNAMRTFSIAVPARLENEWLQMPKPRGFLADKDTTPRPEIRYTRKTEVDTLRRLQQKMAEHRQRLDELEKSIQQFTRVQGVF